MSKPIRILEIGYGTISKSAPFSGGAIFDQPVEYVGVDLKPPAAEHRDQHTSSAFFMQANGRALPFADESFDIVLMRSVASAYGMGHSLTERERADATARRAPGFVVDFTKDTLSEVGRVVRPSGTVVLAEEEGMTDPESLQDVLYAAGFRTEYEEMIDSYSAYINPPTSDSLKPHLGPLAGFADCPIDENWRDVRYQYWGDGIYKVEESKYPIQEMEFGGSVAVPYVISATLI